MILLGSYTTNLTIGDFYSRNVSDYDYDEVLFWEETGKRWLILDRTILESFASSIDGNGNDKLVLKNLVYLQHHIYIFKSNYNI